MNKRILAALALFAAVIWIAPPVQAGDPALPETLYYLSAEVVSIQDGQTRFAQIDGETPTLYIYDVPGTFPEDIPYLLTMDSQGTATPADDAVVVVWGCLSGTETGGPASP